MAHNISDDFEGKIIFNDGQIYEGVIKSGSTFLSMVGKYYKLNPKNEEIEVKKLIFDFKNKIIDPPNTVITHLPENTHINSIQQTNSTPKNQKYKVVFNNGDTFEGRLTLKDMKLIKGKGTLTYHDGRHPQCPSITLRIKNGFPYSGEGILDICGSSTIYKGNFEVGGRFTAFNSHKNEKDEYIREGEEKWSRTKTFLDSGHIQKAIFNKQHDKMYTGSGMFKINGLEVEGNYKSGNYQDCKIRNLESGIIYKLKKIDISNGHQWEDYDLTQISNMTNDKNQQKYSSKLIGSYNNFSKFEGTNFTSLDNKFTISISHTIKKSYDISNRSIVLAEIIYNRPLAPIKKSIGIFELKEHMDFDLLKGIKIYADGSVGQFDNIGIKERTIDEYLQRGEVVLEDKFNFLKRENKDAMINQLKLERGVGKIQIMKDNHFIFLHEKGSKFAIYPTGKLRSNFGINSNEFNVKFEGSYCDYQKSQKSIVYEPWKQSLTFGQDAQFTNIKNSDILNFLENQPKPYMYDQVSFKRFIVLEGGGNKISIIKVKKYI